MKKYFNMLLLFTIILTTPILSQAFTPWPDTGQTTSYTDTFGEDSDYSRNPQSYTKLASGGVELPDTDTSSDGWIMVKDNITGLIWEIKTDDGSIHDKDNTSMWCDSNSTTNGGDSGTCDEIDTETFIDTLNNSSFGGFSDWRMPTIEELLTIVNYDKYDPAINTTFFPNTQSDINDPNVCYWSSTTYADSTGNAWYVHFSTGYENHNRKVNMYYVRAVRAGQSESLDHLVDNGDGTVTDTSTGLMWQQDTQGAMTWEEAITYCESLSFASYDDWRLPDINELFSLVDYSKFDPAIDTTFFPNTQSYEESYYWSSTTYTDFTDEVWCMETYGGGRWPNPKSYTYYVLAVRAGQSGSLGDSTIWYQDYDGDEYGDPNNHTDAISQPSGYVSDNTDCDDNDATINPGATEIAGDGIDQDCDGVDQPLASGTIIIEPDLSFTLPDVLYQSPTGDLNLWVDFTYFGEQDGQLLWELEDYGTTTSTGNPIILSSDLSFNFDATYNSPFGDMDLEVFFTYFGEQSGKFLWELDSYTVGDSDIWYQDSDGDGYGNPDESMSASTQPSDYVSDNTDCDDTDAAINPGTTEIAGDGIDQDCDGSDLAVSDSTCGAYVAPGVWKEFDCYNLAAIGKTTSDDPFTPSWSLIGGYWQWGRKGPDSSQWYDTNTANFAHGPTGSGTDEANSDSISSWDENEAPDGAWSDDSKTANDPCPAGYRVPTQSQWDGVTDNNIQSTVGTWDSDDTNYSSARLFGNDLMLPAAGRRSYSSGMLFDRGNLGHYWSSTQYSIYGRYLYFNSSNVYAYSNRRRLGYSVRCIAEDGITYQLYYLDDDGDGYGDPDYPYEAISQPSGYVIDNTDCDDNDATIHPGATEIAGDGIDQDCDGSDLTSSGSTCGAYVSPGVWKEFDCYNLAAIGKTTNDDPFTPSWSLIGGYWQWGRKGPDSSQWYDTNTENFAHGPTGPDSGDANDGEISSWDDTYAPDDSWSDTSKTANDPCPAGYRVPTESQWDGVLDNNTQSTVGSWSDSSTNYSSAMFFGNDLMLPAAGYRNLNSSGSLDNRGSHSFYCSSTQSTSDYAYAWALKFYSSNASMTGAERKLGVSVRCVAE
jgi:uncharacterized protein (TIGR02145 family)